MAEYVVEYVDEDELHREIDTRSWKVDEADILMSAKKGDNWVRSAIEKHGENTHADNTLMHYATRWAWYQVMLFKIGDKYKADQEPLFMKGTREECQEWFKGGVATYNRSKIGSVRINRGVPCE